MKINKTISKILAVVMMFSIFLPSIAYGEGKIIKEETVYVNLDNSGENIETISSIWLHSDTSLNTVEDKSILEEVTNVKVKKYLKLKMEN